MRSHLLFVALISVSLIAQTAPAISAEYGQFFKVSPRGAVDPPNSAQPPTRLSLSVLKLRPGDYVGMRNFGDYANFHVPGSPERLINMNGYFAKPGQQLNPLYPYNNLLVIGCDHPKGFYLDWAITDLPLPLHSRWTILKIPTGTTEVLLTSECGAGSPGAVDVDRDYGVRVTRPNSPLTSFGVTATMASDSGQSLAETNKRDFLSDPGIKELFAKASRDKNLPQLVESSTKEARAVGSLGISSLEPVPEPQYRGWHVASNRCLATTGKSTCWKPDMSRFCNEGTACPRLQNHWGIDLFAPEGSHLRAPVAAKVYSTTSNDFGHITGLAFRVGTTPYLLMFAHLYGEPFYDDGDIVSKGALFAHAGCTGDSMQSQKCGAELASAPVTAGARSDHTHIELIRGNALTIYANWPPRAKDRLNPVQALGWQVKTPTN